MYKSMAMTKVTWLKVMAVLVCAAMLLAIIPLKPVAAATANVPKFSIPAGPYAEPQTVSLSSDTFGAIIRYTTDGSVPTASSPVYTGPIYVDSITQIRAYAEIAGGIPSANVEALYVIANVVSEWASDFNNDNLSNWQTYTGQNTSGSWALAGGELTAANASGNKAIFKNMMQASPQHFILEADINPYASAQNSGFVFRVTDPGDGNDTMSGYFVGFSSAGTLAASKMTRDGSTGQFKQIFSRSGTDAAKVTANQKNHLKIVGVGTTYYIYVNDRYEYKFTDNEHTIGTVGLRFWNTAGKVSFSNIKITSLASKNIQPVDPDLSGFTVDSFDSATLQSEWSIFQPLASNWSLTSNPGYLTIRTTATDIYQSDNSLNNLFLHSVPDNFEIVTKLYAPILRNHQQAGLVVWQDADNFFKLSSVWADGKMIETAYEVGGNYSKATRFAPHPGGLQMTVKIRKVGNVYTTYYWGDNRWVQAADPVSLNLKNIKVGLFGSNAVATDYPMNVKFDYFAFHQINNGGVDISPKAAEMNIGDTLQLVNLGDSKDEVVWSSSNPSIVTIDTSGKVEAKSPGRVMIKAVSLDGDFSSQTTLTVMSGKQPGEVLYSEDFGNQANNTWVKYGGTWTIQDGALQVNNGPGYKALINSASFTDFTMETDIKIVDGTEAGLVFRAKNPAVGTDALDGYYIGINSGNKAVFGEFTNGKWRELASRNLPIRVNEWYRVKINADGDHFQIYINDNPLNTNPYPKFDLAEASHPETGFIGVRTFNATAQFDNVKISAYQETIDGPTYTNQNQLPNIADPQVMLYKELYYLYGTNTEDHPNMMKGIKVYTSPDLTNWTDHGYALKSEDSWGEDKFWAPEVYEKNGKFYMYYAVEEHLAVATSDSPLGPFKQAIQQPLHLDTKEIDAHMFTDDDGKSYLYFVRFNNNNHIEVAELNDDMLTIKEDTIKFVFAPTQDWELSQKPPVAKVNEGPFVIKHNGTYYMTYSGNHFQSPDYGVGYATAPTPLGPWTKYDYNPIMKSNALVPGAGHHSLIWSPDGKELFIVYHTHNRVGQVEPRKLAIDRVQFVPQASGTDAMEVWGPTMMPQPLPSGSTLFVAPESVTVRAVGGLGEIKTKGGMLQLSADVLPQQATNKQVQWSIVSGAQFATVSGSGLVTAIADGTVTVKAVSTSDPAVAGTIAIQITGQTADNPEDSGPLIISLPYEGVEAWYKLDEAPGSPTARDFSGNGNHSLSTAGTWLPTGGVNGGAISLNGTTDIIQLNGSSSTFLKNEFQQHAVALWFKANNTTARQVLYERGGNVSGLGLQLNNNKLEAAVVGGGSAINSLSIPFTDTAKWHHVLVSFDKGDFRMYLDGVQAGQKSTGLSKVPSALNEAGLGGRVGVDAFGGTSTGAYFNGLLDDVRLYNTAAVPVIGKVKVTGISMKQPNATLDVGAAYTAEASIAPFNASDTNVVWSSSDPSVATVSTSAQLQAKIEAKSKGSATITATTVDGNFIAAIEITVRDVALEGIALNPIRIQLPMNISYTLTPTFKPAGATNRNVVWKSDNPSVASVDANGKVTTLAPGQATISVTTEEGGFTAACSITVKEADSRNQIYIMAYFRSDVSQTGQRDQKLHYSYSRDGVRWYELNGNQPVTYFANELRDPFIAKGEDGIWRLVSTAPILNADGSNGPSNLLLYAESQDLINWTNYKLLDVMKSYKDKGINVFNSWAPEWSYDPVNQEYVLYWSSTLVNNAANDNKHYYLTTKDWVNFSDAKLLFDPGKKTIDATMYPISADEQIDGQRVRDKLGIAADKEIPGNTVWYMFFKDETPESDGGMRNRQTWSTDGITDTSSYQDPAHLSGYVTPLKTEGPEVFKVADKWHLIYDYWWAGKYGLKTTTDITDPSKWSEENMDLRTPYRARHAGIASLSDLELWNLIHQYSLEAYYPFSGNAQDHSGHKQDGEAIGNPKFFAAGTDSGYTALSGDGDAIKLTQNSQSFYIRTISMWVKADGTDRSQMLYQEGNKDGGLALKFEGNKLIAGVSKAGDVKTVSTDYSDIGWHLVTVVYEEGILKLYVDGAGKSRLDTGFQPKQSSLNQNGEDSKSRNPDLYSIKKTTSAATIGTGAETDVFGTSSETAYFKGAIGQVEIYTLPLFDQDISELYMNSKSSFENLKIEKTIASVPSMPEVKVPYGTRYDQLNLPNEVEVTLDDETSTTVGVSWTAGNYDGSTSGSYSLGGTLLPAEGVNNNNHVHAQMVVTVLDPTDPAGPSGVQITGPSSVLSNQSLSLTYSMSNVTANVYAQDLTVNFNPEQLQFVSAESLVDGFEIVGKAVNSGSVRFLTAATGSKNTITGTMDLLKLNFRAQAVAQSVSSTVRLNNVVVADRNGAETPLSGISAYNVLITVPSVDKSALNSKIAAANEVIATAKISSTRWGHYPQSAIDALTAESNNAIAVASSGSASQSDVNQAVMNLDLAMAAFAAAVNTKASIGDLAILAANYGADSSSPDWSLLQMYDFDHNNKLDIFDLAAMANKILDR